MAVHLDQKLVALKVAVKVALKVVPKVGQTADS